MDLEFWVNGKNGRERVLGRTNCSQKNLWAELYCRVHKKECLWVAGWNIYEVMCWADFYAAITSGQWTCSVPTKIVNGCYVKESFSRMFGAFVCENPPTIVDVAKVAGGSVRFVDLHNYGLKPQCFLDAGEKQSIDTTVQAIEDYLTAVKELKMGSLKATAAAQGFGCYRTHHMEDQLFPNQDDEVRSIERASYFAGRAEAFHIGKLSQRLYHVDVHGMYNSIAQKELFPTKLLYKSCGSNFAREQLGNVSVQYIADVTIETDEPCYPVRHGGIVIFPVGLFRTTLANPELHYARDKGHIVEVHKSSCYESHRIFRGFSSWYFASLARLEELGLRHLKPALKLLGNSMFGKIGGRGKNWTPVEWKHTEKRWAQWWGESPRLKHVTQFRALDGVISYLDGTNEPVESMPSISATMNSYGRMELWRLIRKAGRENVCYVDTDGLILTQVGFDRLQDEVWGCQAKPGDLTIREQGNDAEIFGIKHYRFEERVCCAGVTVGRQYAPDGSVMTVQHEPFNYGLWHRNPFVHKYNEIWKRHHGHYRHGHRNVLGSVSPFFMAAVVSELSTAKGPNDERVTYEIVGSDNTA